MSDSYAFIGDIHGALPPLVGAVDRAQDAAQDIVFLGDYVNRGPQSREVLDFLIELNDRLGDRVHFLSGHHDVGFLDALICDRVDKFLRMGGAATLSNYPRADSKGRRLTLQQRVPAAHVNFLRNLSPSFTTAGCIAMHDQTDSPPTGADLFGVFGHSPQQSTRPFIAQDFALIDTGCGTLPHGRLTCFLWPSRQWFQLD